MNKKIIVAGHVCIDITPAFPQKKGAKLGELLQPGKLIEMGDATVSLGGAVSNAGLGMKVLGGNVTLMGKLGTDSFGDLAMSLLDGYGVADGMIRSGEVGSSYTIVLAVPGYDRIFLHNPGTNNVFYASDIPVEELEGAALFHFGYPPIMRSMYQNDGEELIRMMKKVQAAGCAASLDLAVVDPHSEAGRADWKLILQKVMPYVDFFVPSAEELCFMLDRERFDEWNKRADGGDVTEILDLDKDIRPLADLCMEMGTRILLLKCGASGMYLRTAGKEVLAAISPRAELDLDRWADLDYFEESYVPDRIASGTGAGDTSIAAFLLSVLNQETPQMCMHLAAATGACCVSAYDSLSGLKPISELKERIAAGWPKLKR